LSRAAGRRGASEAELAAQDVGVGDVYALGDGEPPRLLRVLWVDVTLRRAILLALGDNAPPVSEPLASIGARIAAGELRWTSIHPFKKPPPPQKPSGGKVDPLAKVVRPKNAPRARKSEWELIEERRALIAPLAAAARDGSLFDEGYPKKIAEHARSVGASRSTVARVVRTWFEYGMTDAALGSQWRRCGGRGKPKKWRACKPSGRKDAKALGIALTDRVREAFAWGVKWLIENPRQPRMDGFNAMNAEFFSEGTMTVGEVELPKPIARHLRPTETQFARHVRKHLPHSQRVRARRGERHYRLNVAPVFGTTSGRSFGPGSMCHVDSSPTAIRITNAATRTMDLGQPRLYFAMDDFSSVLTGRHATLDAEKAEDYALLIADSFIGVIKAPRAISGAKQQPDVRKFITKEGFTDKGGAFLSELSESIYRRMGASVANPPGGSPNQRGKGEQRFNMLNAFSDWMPGAISKRNRSRADKKRGGDMSLTMDEYLAIVDEFMRWHNSTHRPSHAPLESYQEDGRPRTAFDLMLWGFRNRGVPDRADADHVRLCLYEHVVATVDGHRRGLAADGVFYQTRETLPDLDFERPTRAMKGEWIILRNHERVGDAWLLYDNGTSAVPLEVAASSAAWAAMTAAELKAWHALGRKSVRNGRDEVLAHRAAATTVTKKIADESKIVRGRKGKLPPNEAVKADEAAELRADTRAKLMAACGPAPDGPPKPRAEPRVRSAAPASAARADGVEEFRAMRAHLMAQRRTV
jgi:putative transposase